MNKISFDNELNVLHRALYIHVYLDMICQNVNDYSILLLYILSTLPISYTVESWLHKRQKQTAYKVQNFNKKKLGSPDIWNFDPIYTNLSVLNTICHSICYF